MKFVADESVDYQIVSRLREDGHEVIYIAETQSGASGNSVGLPQERKAAIVAEAIRKHGAAMPGAFTVLTPTTIRIRHKDS